MPYRSVHFEGVSDLGQELKNTRSPNQASERSYGDYNCPPSRRITLFSTSHGADDTHAINVFRSVATMGAG